MARQQKQVSELKAQQTEYFKRTTQMELKANESLIVAESMHNEYKKKLIKQGNDLIKIQTLKDQVDNSLKAQKQAIEILQDQIVTTTTKQDANIEKMRDVLVVEIKDLKSSNMLFSIELERNQ